MGVALTAEQIKEIMAPKTKAQKPKTETVRFPAPPQHGPLRYVDRSTSCVVAGYWSYPESNEEKVWVKTRGCRTQTHYRLNGIPMCSTHVIRAMNDLLIDSKFDFTEFIMTADEALESENEELREQNAKLIRVADRLNGRLHEIN
jgi:hypothetical protein